MQAGNFFTKKKAGQDTQHQTADNAESQAGVLEIIDYAAHVSTSFATAHYIPTLDLPEPLVATRVRVMDIPGPPVYK